MKKELMVLVSKTASEKYTNEAEYNNIYQPLRALLKERAEKFIKLPVVEVKYIEFKNDYGVFERETIELIKSLEPYQQYYADAFERVFGEPYSDYEFDDAEHYQIKDEYLKYDVLDLIRDEHPNVSDIRMLYTASFIVPEGTPFVWATEEIKKLKKLLRK